MSKIVIVGDQAITGNCGLCAVFRASNLLSTPPAFSQVHIITREDLTISGVCALAPSNIIGKAPNCLLVAAGYSDCRGQLPLHILKSHIIETTSLFKDKTNAKVFFLTVCKDFLKNEEQTYIRAADYNELLFGLQNEGLFSVIDIDSSISSYIKYQMNSSGELQSLFEHGPKFTLLGALLASTVILEAIKKV